MARTRRDLPILARQPGFDALTAVRAGRVYVTDGNAYFSRPGPRLVDSLDAEDLARSGVHPSLGALAIPDWIEFFLLHEAHHLYQAMLRMRGA